MEKSEERQVVCRARGRRNKGKKEESGGKLAGEKEVEPTRVGEESEGERTEIVGQRLRGS